MIKSLFFLSLLFFMETQVFAQRGRVSVYDYADEEYEHVRVSENKHPILTVVIKIGMGVGVFFLLILNSVKNEEKKRENSSNNTSSKTNTYHSDDDLPF